VRERERERERERNQAKKKEHFAQGSVDDVVEANCDKLTVNIKAENI
jgi:hypothetical protein